LSPPRLRALCPTHTYVPHISPRRLGKRRRRKVPNGRTSSSAAVRREARRRLPGSARRCWRAALTGRDHSARVGIGALATLRTVWSYYSPPAAEDFFAAAHALGEVVAVNPPSCAGWGHIPPPIRRRAIVSQDGREWKWFAKSLRNTKQTKYTKETGCDPGSRCFQRKCRSLRGRACLWYIAVRIGAFLMQ
jgi:hypothetical protein